MKMSIGRGRSRPRRIGPGPEPIVPIRPRPKPGTDRFVYVAIKIRRGEVDRNLIPRLDDEGRKGYELVLHYEDGPDRVFILKKKVT